MACVEHSCEECGSERSIEMECWLEREERLNEGF